MTVSGKGSAISDGDRPVFPNNISQVEMAHFCALISQNLHLKTTNINWKTKSSCCLGDFVVVLTFWLRLVRDVLRVQRSVLQVS